MIKFNYCKCAMIFYTRWHNYPYEHFLSRYIFFAH